MKHAILPTYALIILVWLHSPTHAQAPLSSFRTPPPNYYQVIITNNLFRPLGWTKPKPPPAFELIATVMKINGKHRALIRNTRNRKFYYAAVGELAGEAIVEKIEAHRVTLKRNGESKVYRLPL